MRCFFIILFFLISFISKAQNEYIVLFSRDNKECYISKSIEEAQCLIYKIGNNAEDWSWRHEDFSFLESNYAMLSKSIFFKSNQSLNITDRYVEKEEFRRIQNVLFEDKNAIDAVRKEYTSGYLYVLHFRDSILLEQKSIKVSSISHLLILAVSIDLPDSNGKYQYKEHRDFFAGLYKSSCLPYDPITYYHDYEEMLYQKQCFFNREEWIGSVKLGFEWSFWLQELKEKDSLEVIVNELIQECAFQILPRTIFYQGLDTIMENDEEYFLIIENKNEKSKHIKADFLISKNDKMYDYSSEINENGNDLKITILPNFNTFKLLIPHFNLKRGDSPSLFIVSRFKSRNDCDTRVYYCTPEEFKKIFEY